MEAVVLMFFSCKVAFLNGRALRVLLKWLQLYMGGSGMGRYKPMHLILIVFSILSSLSFPVLNLTWGVDPIGRI
jgi:hypothetical protein